MSGLSLNPKGRPDEIKGKGPFLQRAGSCKRETLTWCEGRQKSAARKLGWKSPNPCFAVPGCTEEQGAQRSFSSLSRASVPKQPHYSRWAAVLLSRPETCWLSALKTWGLRDQGKGMIPKIWPWGKTLDPAWSGGWARSWKMLEV